MPSLSVYDKKLDYSYALGLFPAIEALSKRPQLVRRVLVGAQLEEGEALQQLRSLCTRHRIRMEEAGRLLERLSRKENCFAAAVFAKQDDILEAQTRHLVLHHPADKGNLGTILRTALGFDFLDIAIITPGADHFDPHVVRASMGAMFSLRIAHFDTMEAYCAAYGGRALYPFMLQGTQTPQAAARQAAVPYSLIMGNEGSGLPDNFQSLGQAVRIDQSPAIDSLNVAVAAAVGMYTFRQAEKECLPAAPMER